MSDYYTENLSRLNGQPKRTIADYVESQGILVPRRFDSLAEARDFDGLFIARSEHTQEYAGASGVLFSPKGEELEGIISQDGIKDKVIQEKGDLRIYCTLKEIDMEEFLEHTSFSFWERLGGFNRMVTADSAIRGRYHVTTFKGKVNAYTLVEQNEVIGHWGVHLPKELERDIGNLIELYETIRNLERFDPKHCPIMEFQTADGKNNFLQYHRVRDFEPTTFQLEEHPGDDYIEAHFSRGATPQNGLSVQATTLYAGLFGGLGSWKLPKREEAPFGFPNIPPLPELLARQRKVQLNEVERGPENFLCNVAIGHFARPKLFKPKVSLLIPAEHELCNHKELTTMHAKARKTGEDQKIKLHVISDGRKAYVKRL